MEDEDDEWEICNDNGFVFKRRRRPRPEPPLSTGRDLNRHHRARKKQSLLAIRDRYAAELARWDSLSSSIPSSLPPPHPPTAASSALCPPPPSRLPPIDELLSLVEAQEMMIRSLGEMCEFVEAVCEERERLVAQALLDLPIWGSPRSLIASLSD